MVNYNLYICIRFRIKKHSKRIKNSRNLIKKLFFYSIYILIQFLYYFLLFFRIKKSINQRIILLLSFLIFIIIIKIIRFSEHIKNAWYTRNSHRK
mmetsp:Transcript_3492/g.324  ORF Transcript_3492/g.324 Transcript_3492/m.324 type:complete len:95 (-) Transcript_3492:323-607(-)